LRETHGNRDCLGDPAKRGKAVGEGNIKKMEWNKFIPRGPPKKKDGFFIEDRALELLDEFQGSTSTV